VLKRDQEKGRGRERKTERERKACVCVCVCVCLCVCVCVRTRAYTLAGQRRRARGDGVNERGDSPSGRRTGARGPESRRSEHVLLSASRVEKARGNFQVLKRPLITRDRVGNSLLHFSSRYTRCLSAHLPRGLIANLEESKMENRRFPRAASTCCTCEFPLYVYYDTFYNNTFAGHNITDKRELIL
jgi:hypothetical protein